MTNTYLVLLRGINVGGKNLVPMAGLKKFLEELGYFNVSTYIASGNVILKSDKPIEEIKAQIESNLTKNFKLDSELIRVLVLTQKQVNGIVNQKPDTFGDQPEKYYNDVIFLMDIDQTQAMTVFKPREGVDNVWLGIGVIYWQRLSALRTQSRLSAIMASPLYKSMTIRTWNTKVTDRRNMHQAALWQTGTAKGGMKFYRL
ncbi:MAG: DUF1697 domain-containing protein [Actinobacteria bacterium]|nr:DUF1697 domain-containing protein [Actinomycetota bacterium]